MHPLPDVISDHMDEIRALCAKHRVKELSVFGSAANGQFDPARSDVDFLAELLPYRDPIEAGRALVNLIEDLEQLLGRRVDLATRRSLRNPFFRKELNETARQLYAA